MRRFLIAIVVSTGCNHPPPALPAASPVTCARYVASLPAPATEAFEAGQWQETIDTIEASWNTRSFARAAFREAWSYWKLGDQPRADRLLKQSLDEVVMNVRPPDRRSRRAADHDVAAECLVALFASERTITPADVFARIGQAAGPQWAAYLLLQLAHLYDANGRRTDAMIAAFTAFTGTD